MFNSKKLILTNASLVLFTMLFTQFLKAQELAKDPDKPSSEELLNEGNKEEATREKDEVAANALVIRAAEAFKEDRFEVSISLYLSAMDRLEKSSNLSSYVDAKIKNIKQNMAVVYHYWARSIAVQAEKDVDEEKFVEAMKNCAKAVKMDPSLSTKIERLLKRIEDKKKLTKYRSVTDEAVVDGNKEDRLYQIDILMAQGRKLYDQKLWHRARDKFEAVQVLDPYNLAAVEKIKKLTKKMYSAGVHRYETTRQERSAETEWKLLTPLIPRSLEPNNYAPEPIIKEVSGSKINRKLNEIMIEHMEFEDASILAVINELRREAKDKDKDNEGINIILRMASAAPAIGGPASGGDDAGVDGLEEDFFDEAGTIDDPTESGTAGSEESGEGGVTITIMFDDLSLGEAIRNICLAAELKYRVEEYAVVIAAKNVLLDDLETRIYPIDSEAGMTNDDGDVSDTGTASVQGFFARQGIFFADGAKVVYDASISRLIATNTPEQLKQMERIINELNVIDPQVLIECKFVEFHESKENEFGIAWTYGRPAGVAGTGDNSVTFDTNDDPLRYLGNISGVGGDPLVRTGDKAFEISRTDKDGLSYGAEVRALDLSGDTNVLSCPRITTQNGEEATIRMVTEVYFPESWGEPTLIDDGTVLPDPPPDPLPELPSVGYVSSMPEFGDPTELGVRLTVTPTVDPDKYTITLDMVPVVQSQIDWTDYSYTQQTSAGSVRNTVKMVIIEARTVTTQVTIYDGETIVMGGIMRDVVTNVDDRWPILGDLPLIGRFFRSTYETSLKENLLIFTTPRLVNPNGSPLRQREVRGKPPFRM